MARDLVALLVTKMILLPAWRRRCQRCLGCHSVTTHRPRASSAAHLLRRAWAAVRARSLHRNPRGTCRRCQRAPCTAPARRGKAGVPWWKSVEDEVSKEWKRVATFGKTRPASASPTARAPAQRGVKGPPLPLAVGIDSSSFLFVFVLFQLHYQSYSLPSTHHTPAMSTQGPPADAKQAQAAALQEIEAAQRRKRALDMSLVRTLSDRLGRAHSTRHHQTRDPKPKIASSSPLMAAAVVATQLPASHALATPAIDHADNPQANVEATIWANEVSYLEDTTASGGNIIKVCTVQCRSRVCLVVVPREMLYSQQRRPTNYAHIFTLSRMLTSHAGLRSIPQTTNQRAWPPQEKGRGDRGRPVVLGQQRQLPAAGKWIRAVRPTPTCAHFPLADDAATLDHDRPRPSLSFTTPPVASLSLLGPLRSLSLAPVPLVDRVCVCEV